MYKKLFLLTLVVTLLFLFVGSSSFAGQTDGLLRALDKKGFAPVTKTGQTKFVTSGGDGDLQMGIPWPDPRFTVNIVKEDGTEDEDGTVTDNLTGLMWTKDAQQIPGIMNWSDAVNACNDLIFADYDDWRLPNVRELHSLIDYGTFDPDVLPIGHPFTNVQPHWYWSSTTEADCYDCAWLVNLDSGNIDGEHKTDELGYAYMWCVRGGQ